METLRKLLAKRASLYGSKSQKPGLTSEERLVFKNGAEVSGGREQAPNEYQLEHQKAVTTVDRLKKSTVTEQYSGEQFSDAISEFLDDNYDIDDLGENFSRKIASKLAAKIRSEAVTKLDSDPKSVDQAEKTVKALGGQNDYIITNNSASKELEIYIKDPSKPKGKNSLLNKFVSYKEIMDLFPNPEVTRNYLQLSIYRNGIEDLPFEAQGAKRQEELLLSSMVDSIDHSNDFPEEYYAPRGMEKYIHNIRRYYNSGLLNNQVLFQQSFSRVGISPKKFFDEVDDLNWFGEARDGVEPEAIFQLTSYSKEFKKHKINNLGEAQNKLVELASKHPNMTPEDKDLARKLSVTIREIHHIGKLVETMAINNTPEASTPNPDYINEFKFEGIGSTPDPATNEFVTHFSDKPEVYVSGLLYMSNGLPAAIEKGYVSYKPLPGSEGDMLVVNVSKIPESYNTAIYEALKDVDTEFKFAKGVGEGTYSITDAQAEIFANPKNKHIKAQLDRAKLEHAKGSPEMLEFEKVKTLAAMIANPVAPYFDEDGSYSLTSAELRDGATLMEGNDPLTREMPDKTIYEHLLNNSRDSEGNLSVSKLESYLNDVRIKAATRAFHFSPEQIKAAGFKDHEDVLDKAQNYKFELSKTLTEKGRTIPPNAIQLARLGIMSELVKPDSAKREKVKNMARLDEAQKAQIAVLSYLKAQNLDLKEFGIGPGVDIPFYAEMDKDGNITRVSFGVAAGINTDFDSVRPTIAGALKISREYKDGDALSLGFGAGLQEGIIAGVSFKDSNNLETSHWRYSAGILKTSGIPVGIGIGAGYGQTRLERANEAGYEKLEQRFGLKGEDIIRLRGLAVKSRSVESDPTKQAEFVKELHNANDFFKRQSEFYNANQDKLKAEFPTEASYLASNLEGIVNATIDVAALEHKNDLGYEIGLTAGTTFTGTPILGAYISIDIPNGQTVIKTINTSSSTEQSAERQAEIDAQIAEQLKELKERNPGAKFVTTGMSGEILRTAEGWELRNTKQMELPNSSSKLDKVDALNQSYNNLGLMFYPIDESDIQADSRAASYKEAGYVVMEMDPAQIDADITFMVDPEANIDISGLRTGVNPKTGLPEVFLNPGRETLVITQHTIWPDRGAEQPRVIYTISNKQTDRDALNDIDNPADIIQIRNGNISVFKRNEAQTNVGIGKGETAEKVSTPEADKLSPLFTFTDAEKSALEKYKEKTKGFDEEATGNETKFQQEKAVLDKIIQLIARYDAGTGRTKSMKIFLSATTAMEGNGYQTEIENIAGELVDHFINKSKVIPEQFSGEELDPIQPNNLSPKGAAYLIDQMTNLSMVNITKLKPAGKESVVSGRTKLFDAYMGDKSKLANKELWKEKDFADKKEEILTSAKQHYKDMLENTQFESPSTKAASVGLEGYMCGTMVAKYDNFIGHRKVLIDKNSFIEILNSSKTAVDEGSSLAKFYLERNDRVHEGMNLNESPLARKLLDINTTFDGVTQPLVSLIAKIHGHGDLNQEKLINIATSPEKADKNSKEYKFVVNILKTLRQNGSLRLETKDGITIELENIADVQTAFIEPCGNFAAFTKEDIQINITGAQGEQQQFLGAKAESTPEGGETRVTGGSLFGINFGIVTAIKDNEEPPPTKTPNKRPSVNANGTPTPKNRKGPSNNS